jgi:hypothetical protein
VTSWRAAGAGIGPAPGAGDSTLVQRGRSLLAAYDAEGHDRGAAGRKARYGPWLADMLDALLEAYGPPVYGAGVAARYPADDRDDEDWRDYRD